MAFVHQVQAQVDPTLSVQGILKKSNGVAVEDGAKSCLIRLAWAPNVSEPLAVVWEMEGRGERQPVSFFQHDRLREVYPGNLIGPEMARGGHFLNGKMPWNRGGY